MTLSLDDVRNKRFRMARKSGYEVLEVDEFVDEVEVAFEQLTEENANLKKQIEALKATPAAEPEPVPAAGSAPVEQAPAEPETIVVTTGAEASSAVVRLVALSTEQAERLVEEATAEAEKIRAEAAASAQELTGDAQARADRISADAQHRADNLDNEIAGRRSELLDGLQAERDELQVAVGQLRSFEAGFRANLTNELREHISTLENRNAQPYEVPALADPAAVTEAQQRSASSTDTGAAAEPATAEASSAPGEVAAAPAETSEDGSVFPSDDPAAEHQTEDDRSSETPRLNALLGDQR